MSDFAEIPIVFAPKGDKEVLDAIRKVTRHVDDLKRIAKAPINLDVVKNSMKPEDFNRLKATIENAKNATRDLGKEAEKAGAQAHRLAVAAEKAQQRKIAAAERASQRMAAAAEKAAVREMATAERAAAVAERAAQRKAMAAERAAERAAVAAEKAAAREARANPSMGGITGSMGGGRGGSIPMPLGGGMQAPDMRAFSSKAVDEMNKALGRTPAKAKAAAEGLGFVGRIIAAMAIRSFIHEVYEMANAFTAFQNKIKAVLKDQSDLNFITKDLIAISQRSRQSLEAVGTIFTRTSRAVEALGRSQFETMKFTETLSKAVAVGGSTSIEAKNAMIQLSQGMSSGTLKGDELRSVLEQLPIVAELIAKKMGVTVGQLRKLGSEGKLTTDVVFSAIIESTQGIDEAFAKMKPTMEQIVNVIKDKFMVAIGQSSGLLDKLTSALQILSDNFDVAFKAAQALAGIMATLGAGKLISMIASIGAGWAGVAAAIAAATVAVVAFSDKIAVSDDGVMKLDRGMNAFWLTFKSDVMDGIKTLEMLTDKFVGLPVKFGFSWDQMMMNLAKGYDLLRVLARPDMLVKGALGNKEALEFAGRTQRNLRGERASARGDVRDANSLKQQETEARFNAMMKGYMPTDSSNTRIPAPVKKGGSKESGKTFQELLEEATAQEGFSRLDDLEEKIRERLHRMTESLKPSIQRALEDVGGNKQIAALEAEFKKEHTKEKYLLDPERIEDDRKALNGRISAIREANAALIEQNEKLEETVRIEMTRDFYAKQRLEQEKEAEKLLEERIKAQKAFEDSQIKMVEASADHQVSRVDRFKGIQSSLDPNIAIQQQIKDMQEFQRFAQKNNLADWALLATHRIEDLQASMRWENSHFQTFADQMNSIFGPGGSLVKGFADAAANAIVMSSSLRDLKQSLIEVLNSVQKQALSSLIQLPMNLALGALTQSLVPGASSSLTSEAGGARSVSAGEASSWGFASGGYTGNMGVNDVAGIVHGQEFVLNADATRRMGRENLEAINKGGKPVSPSAPMAQPKITINNNAGVQVEAKSCGPDEIQVMITKAIRDQTPRVVAGHINDANSPVSRSLQKNLETQRRRS